MRANPYQLTAFAHVVREGSLTAAARKLDVSQSAITQHLQKLEAVVGAKLLIKGRDGLILTPTGQEIFDLAERHVNLEQLISERLAGYSNLEAGHLSIIANAPVPALKLIADYTRIWPNVQIDFTLFDWTTAIEMLQSRQVDIALIFEPTKSTEWVIHGIGQAKYVLYVPSDHRLAGARSVTLRDLASESLLLPEHGSLTQRIVSQAIAKHRLQLRRTIKTTTFPVMKEAILQGVGVGIFLDGCITETENLVSIPIQELPDFYQSCIVIPKEKNDLRLVQSFVSLATKQRRAK